jgi:hypothetical protein
MKHLNALQYLFWALAGCLAVLLVPTSRAIAAAPFNDDFDSYTVGGGNQGGWGGNGCQVESAVYNSSPNSLRCGNATQSYYKSGTSLSSGTWYWKFKSGFTGTAYVDFFFGSSVGETFLSVSDNGASDNVADGTHGHAPVTTITENDWHDFGIEWTATQWRIYVDGTWYEWNTMTGAENIEFVNMIGNNYGNGYYYLDDWSDASPVVPPVAGWYPILTPTAPVSGQTNTVDFDNFSVAGSISIPTDDTYVWQKLYATFTNTKGIDSVTVEITLPDLASGDSFNYSATSTIANATSTDVYEVNYSAWGYWCDPLYPEYCGKLGLSYPFEISPTFISEGSTPGGGIPPIVVSQWSPPTLEDCTVPTYSILEKFTCQIQNALLGLVIPSAASVNNLFAVFQTFQQKFPFSYVNEISTSFNTIRAALNESATISVKVFGQSGNISLAFWSQPATIGGVTTTIGATFKVILTFFLLLIFLAWGIGYLHRIL